MTSRDATCEYRGIVQLVERWSPKPNVVGSNPTAPAIKRLQKRCSQRKLRFYRGFRHLYGEISANDFVDIKKVFSLCKRF